jgi:hypothetical protein
LFSASIGVLPETNTPDWKNFIPTTRKYFEEMWQVLKIDILQIKSKEHLAVGHNALAGFIYFLTFIAVWYPVSSPGLVCTPP